MQYNISISSDLKRNPHKGSYFVLEGIDGSGKSTQVERIADYFRNLGKNVVITSEPQATGEIQKVIRNVLFSKIKISPRAYQDLYSADRAVNHAEIIEPALSRGDVVLSHRSFWSAIAYGVLDLGEAYDFQKASAIFLSQGIISGYHQFLAPDKTFYLRVSADHATSRLAEMNKQKDLYEKKEKLAKIVTGYERVIQEFRDEFIVIDGEMHADEVTQQIIKHL